MFHFGCKAVRTLFGVIAAESLLAFLIVGLSAVAAEPGASLSEDAKLRLSSQLKHRAANTRLAALHELGNNSHVDAVQLVVQFGLRDSTPEVRDAATQILRDHRLDVQVGQYLWGQWKLEALAKRRPNQEFAQRLLTIVCDYRLPEVYRDILEMMDNGDAVVSLALLETMMPAIDAAAVAKDTSLLKILDQLAECKTFSRSFGFQRCVVDAAARIPDAAAVSFLVRQVAKQNGELQFVAVQHLRRITKQSLPVESAPWEVWWQAHRAAFHFDASELPPPDSLAADQGTPLYYDIPIHAKRVVFVLDTSRSMAQATTIPRLESAKRELIRAIELLPADTLFNVVAFNTKISTWSDKMAPATGNWKAHAIAFVRSQKPTGKTATSDALRAAFALDSNLEAVYLLSDGEPSAGTVIPPKMLLEFVRKQNRVRRLTVHTIAVIGRDPDAEGLEEFMRQLAAQNYGEFRRIE